MAEELDEITIPLKKPITVGEDVYSEIKLREPTGAEWMQFDKISGAEGNMLAISVISGIPIGVVKRMGTSDIVKATRFLDRFF